MPAVADGNEGQKERLDIIYTRHISSFLSKPHLAGVVSHRIKMASLIRRFKGKSKPSDKENDETNQDTVTSEKDESQKSVSDC